MTNCGGAQFGTFDAHTMTMQSAWHKLSSAPALAVALLAGCGSDEPAVSQPKIPEARSNAARLAADAPAQSVQTLCANNASFAIDLLHAAKPAANFFYSPHSLSIGLAMTYAGAASTTQTEMATVLHFAQPDGELHGAFNTLDQTLASRGQNAQGIDGQPFRLRISNAAWAQTGLGFLPSYLDLLAQDYGAGVELVDFANTEAARQTINGWVSHETERKIPELLSQTDLDANTVLVLTNTVYFNASWAKPFPPESTQDGGFTLLDGSSVSVPLMHGIVDGSYAEGSGWKAAEIDYAGHEVSLVAVLPDEGTFESFEQALDQTKLAEITGAFAGVGDVYITLPKLQIRTRLDLGGTLSEMGMPSAFSVADADFSGMTGSKGLYIQRVIHEAFVNVNEAGTEAAAATAVSMGRLALPQSLALTGPFLFLIRDKQTGAVVFLGRVVDPTAG